LDVPEGLPPQPLSGKVGSLGAFWPLLEPVLDALAPRRICEVGVEGGAFAAQLLDWCRPRGCVYIGVDLEPPADMPELAGPDAAGSGVIRGDSLDVLPRLAACDAYFIDGDHNYYTVRRELDAVERAAERLGGRAPLICLHDVGWPWGRRDMYYAPQNIPPEHRHASSTELGVALHSDELVDGGLRDPGRYAIACHAGGARNGVLTAVEDFVAASSAAGAAWQLLLVPAAFGLAVLYRPDMLPEACTQHVHRLRTAADALGDFLRLVELNYMSLFLFGEDAKRHADGLQREFTALEKTYAELLEHFNGLQRAYGDLSNHSDSLLNDYKELDKSYRSLQNDRSR
jgi:hypothetical protein